MSNKNVYTESEAVRLFAIQYNNKTWALLDQKERTLDKPERCWFMRTSLAQWRATGITMHHQHTEQACSRIQDTEDRNIFQIELNGEIGFSIK